MPTRKRRAQVEQVAIALLDSSIRQRHKVLADSLTIHFQLMNGFVVLGSATLRDGEVTSLLERKCYLDAVNNLSAIIILDWNQNL